MKDGIFLGVLCLSGWLTFATRLPRQYHYVAQPMTWTGARSHCRGSFLDIATIGSLEEMNQLIKTVPSAGNSSEVWIGLFDEIKWRWSDGYTGSGADYRKWELSYNEPNFYEAGEFCVTIDNDRGWYDAFCTGQYPFMCYNGSMLDPHFVYVNEYMNWSDAQNYCREHFTDLATVRNDTENLKIHKLLTENKDSWIGLFRDPHFYWSDGSVFSFSYWYTDYNYLGSRTLVCGVADLEKSGRWRLRPCTRKLPFVCYSIPVCVCSFFHVSCVTLFFPTNGHFDFVWFQQQILLLNNADTTLQLVFDL